MSSEVAATARPRLPVNWLLEFFRAVAIVLSASLLGVVANLFSARPVPLFAANGPGAFPAEAPRISPGALREALALPSPPLLLDARDRADFDAGRPAGAVHLDAEKFHEEYDKVSSMLKAAPEIVIFCTSNDCPLADELAKHLIELKFEKVRVLDGGWLAYKNSGMPMEKSN